MNGLNLQLVYVCIVICPVAEWYQFAVAGRLAQLHVVPYTMSLSLL